MTKDARVTIRVDAAALKTVTALAEREQRPVAQMLRILLSEALRARLEVPDPKHPSLTQVLDDVQAVRQKRGKK